MKKLTGKISAPRRRNYLSLMYIPHRKGGIRTFRIQNYRTTLLCTLAILLMALLSLTGYTLALAKENKAMAIEHEEQINAIMEQKLQLESFLADQTNKFKENTELVTSAVNTKSITDDAIENYKSEYEKLVLSYADDSFTAIKTVSRGSGATKTATAFKEGVSDLKNLINVLQDAKIEEDQLDNLISSKETELTSYLASLPTFWPCDSTTVYSAFGMRLHPIKKVRLLHEGVDLGNTKNAPIYAAADGKVTLVGWNGGYGKCVIIDHGNGYKTIYGHLNGYKVKEGEWVKKGQTIALMGNTGLSTGTHLHFEVRVNDVPIQPLNFIEKP